MDICSGVGLWDHTIPLFLVFWGTSVLFTIVVTFPPGVERKECSFLSTPSTAFIIFQSVQVQFSRSVMSNSWRPQGLQQARLPCPSPTPGACSNSYPLSWWCYLIISFSVTPFSSPLFILYQHQGLFQWVGSSHQVANILEFQHQSFQWRFRVDSL